MFIKRKEFDAFKKQYTDDFAGLVLRCSELEERHDDLKHQFEDEVGEKIESEKKTQQLFSEGLNGLMSFDYGVALNSNKKRGE